MASQSHLQLDWMPSMDWEEVRTLGLADFLAAWRLTERCSLRTVPSGNGFTVEQPALSTCPSRQPCSPK